MVFSSLPTLIIFDMAGTTILDHHEVESCFAQAAAQTGLNMTPEEITSVQGWSKRHVFETYWQRQASIDQLSPAAVDERADHSYRIFKEILENHYRQAESVRPSEGCLALFQELRRRQIPVALTTGFYRTVADVLLDRLGWSYPGFEVKNSVFELDYSVTSDEVAEGRPSPEMIRRCMNALGIASPAGVMNIGDTPSDLESGNRAGVGMNFGVTNGTHTEFQLSSYPNDGLYSSLAEIHQTFFSANPAKPLLQTSI